MKMPDLFVTVAPSRACAHTIRRTVCFPSVRHAVFRLAAPSFPIPPSHARTVKHHLRRTVFSHPAIPRPHRQTPSSSPRLFPSHHPTPAPSNTISVAPSFPIPPSCSRTIHFHPPCSILLHPPVPCAHRPSPFPFSRPFSPCKKENRKNFKKMQKRC